MRREQAAQDETAAAAATLQATQAADHQRAVAEHEAHFARARADLAGRKEKQEAATALGLLVAVSF